MLSTYNKNFLHLLQIFHMQIQAYDEWQIS